MDIYVPVQETQGETDNSDAQSIGYQRKLLTGKRLLVAFPALSVALFGSFIDQTSVSTCIPAISAELGTGSSTSRISSSFLIALTAFLLINGRMSDIFGRKNVLSCSATIALGDLLCGFARSKEQLFYFRAIAGIGGGGVNSVVLIIVSNMTTLKNRGKYQGIIGAIIASANGIGVFLEGAVIEKTSWRWVFWIVPLIAVPAGLVIFFLLTLRFEAGNYLEKAKKVHYGGILLSLATALLILVPLPGAGVTYAWNSATLLGIIIVGAVMTVLFVLFEWKVASLPIMPLRVFQAPNCAYMYAQSFFSGIVHYGNFFYREWAIILGALMLPIIVATSISSIACGQFLARIGRYMPPIVVGYGLWTVESGLAILFGQESRPWKMTSILLVEGFSIGMTLHTTLIGLLANSRSEDRGVLTTLRNFLRTVGGAFRLTVILFNNLRTHFTNLPYLPADVLPGLTSSTYQLDSLHLTSEEKQQALAVYMEGMHCIFIFYTARSAITYYCALTLGIHTCTRSTRSTRPMRLQRKQKLLLSGFRSLGPRTVPK
ncbi:major facilitator superfamily transporter [Pseudomassariella vexata]|uniref:Major facilitator superfamily transporter n=1 Tax=Pseudomassariella vexata TaxID=1141098 RepID=A0A1Y2DE91_9PEZI|nr:major facilitator superfamily transporter [Pseudomassariella vexata]ORY57559.1 major facilitator superfamily transporter [Pseudomassariella vexata]